MLDEVLGKEIKEKIQGDVQWDEETLEAYSTNQSMYRVKPLLVTFPKNEEDVIKIVEMAGIAVEQNVCDRCRFVFRGS